MNSSLRHFLPLIIWLIVCTVLFTLPGSAFPKENWLDKIQFDKWVHIGLIGLLVLAGAWGFYKYKEGHLTVTILVMLAIAASVYGLAMELVQLYFVANRSFDMGDVIADVAGAAIGARYAWWRFIKK